MPSSSQTIDALRKTLSRFERRGPAPAGVEPQGALRPLFAGGHVFGGLHEIVAAGAPDLFASLGFAFAFAAACAAARPDAGIVLVVEDFAALETGVPYAPGLSRAGIEPARLVLARTANAVDTLIAMELALRSPAVAVVLGESALSPRRYDLAVSRRLLLAARAGGAAGLLVPLAFAGHAERLSSAATARFEVSRAPGERAPAPRLPLPGRPAVALRLLKAPGGLSDAAARSRERWLTEPLPAPFDAAATEPASPDFAPMSRPRVARARAI